jgi:RNA polymerase sigma-70 factor (ECF subfamily)
MPQACTDIELAPASGEPAPGAGHAFADPARARDLAALRPFLMRYARGKLDDSHMAEDAVQDAMLAALAGRSPFKGRSALRTWVTSILRNKIFDVYRRNVTENRQWRPADFDGTDTPAPEDMFHPSVETGLHSDLADPTIEIERRQLASHLMSAVSNPPWQQRDAFVLVHMHGVSGSEAAGRVGVSQNHLWVILHRSRRALQAQLQSAYAM